MWLETVLLLSCLQWCMLVAEPTVTMYVDTANVSQTRLQCGDLLLSCVGASHAVMSLREDWRAHLTQIQRDVGFRYIRFHGLLDDDMSTYLEGKANMFNIFNTFDFLIGIGIRPIVELSFMPIALALNSSQTVFHYKGGTSAPKDWELWYKFISELVQNFVDYYGIDEVSSWKFEVWNEPNCGFLTPDIGPPWCSSAGPKSLYFTLYNNTATAIKKISPKIKVGGPATAQTSWITEFTDFVTKNNVPCDFVSTHLYPTDPNVPQLDRDGFYKILQNASDFAKKSNFPTLITEFNPGLSIDVADGPYAASFIIHNLYTFQNSVNFELLSYWTFSDIFEEGGQISVPYSQAFGMMNIYGIPKPVYRSFQWVSAISKKNHKVVTVDTKNNIDVICVKIESDGVTTFSTLVTNFDVFPRNATYTNVVIRFTNFKKGDKVPQFANIQRIDSEHGNPRSVWEKSGKPKYPGKDQLQKEMAMSVLRTEQIPLKQETPTEFSVNIQLEGYGSAFVQFSLSSSSPSPASTTPLSAGEWAIIGIVTFAVIGFGGFILFKKVGGSMRGGKPEFRILEQEDELEQ